MILDTLDRIGVYSNISPLMDKVREFLGTTDLSTLEPGKIELQGEDIFVNVNFQEARTRSQSPIEAHMEYIDIQIPISSDEEIGFISEAFLLNALVPYSKAKDVAFFPGMCDTYLNVKKGMFAVFLPGEGHAPAITEYGVMKLIIKIRKPC